MRFSAFALPLALLAPLAPVAPAWAEPATRTITVTGEGQVSAVPDMATVTLGVMSDADTAGAALTANSDQLRGVLDRLAAAGIAEKDIQTTGLSLGPRYDYSESSGGAGQIAGYSASNSVTVRVEALEGLGAVLDSAVGSGANTLGGLSFGLKDPTSAIETARKLAVADARARAELYAQTAGVALGPVLTISETMTGGQPAPMFKADMAAAPVPVQAGEISFGAAVTITYEIVDAAP